MHKSACSDNSISIQYVLHFLTIIRTPSFYWIYATVNSNRNIKIDIFMCISALELQQVVFEAIFLSTPSSKRSFPFDVVSSATSHSSSKFRKQLGRHLSLFRYNNFAQIWVEECIICFSLCTYAKNILSATKKTKKLLTPLTIHFWFTCQMYWIIPKVHWVHFLENCKVLCRLSRNKLDLEIAIAVLSTTLQIKRK